MILCWLTTKGAKEKTLIGVIWKTFLNQLKTFFGIKWTNYYSLEVRIECHQAQIIRTIGKYRIEIETRTLSHLSFRDNSTIFIIKAPENRLKTVFSPNFRHQPSMAARQDQDKKTVSSAVRSIKRVTNFLLYLASTFTTRNASLRGFSSRAHAQSASLRSRTWIETQNTCWFTSSNSWI